MKKIVFVEKSDQTSYDPVSNFFNKKAASVVKPSSAAKAPSKIPSQKMTELQATKQVTNSKQQTLKSIKKLPSTVTKEIKGKQLSKEQSIIVEKNETKLIKQRDESLQGPQEAQPTKQSFQSQRQIKSSNEKQIKAIIDSQNKRIKELQAKQTEYLRMIQQYEQKQSQFFKTEQKMLKLQKQMKTAGQRAKQHNQTLEKLAEKQAAMKQLFQSSTIPYNKKRQVLMSNHLRQLKRQNRQLVLRIKSYKGTDLVEMAMHKNRDQITKDFRAEEEPQKIENQINLQMQSKLSRLIQKLNIYLNLRIQIGGNHLPWIEQSKHLLETIHLAEQINLKYLQQFQVCPLPNCNQDCSELCLKMDEYLHRQSMENLMSRFDLNFNLARQNVQILNSLDQNNQEKHRLKDEMSVKSFSKKKNKKTTAINQKINIYKIRSHYADTLVIQSICQLQLTKQWIKQTFSRLSEQLSSLSKVIQQIKSIVELGSTAKQSLMLFMQNNLDGLIARFPNLKTRIKDIQSSYEQVERICSK